MPELCPTCSGRGVIGFLFRRPCESCSGTGLVAAPGEKPAPPAAPPRLHVRGECELCARRPPVRTEFVGGPYDGVIVDLLRGAPAVEYRVPRGLTGGAPIALCANREGIVEIPGGEPGPREVYRREDRSDGTYVFRHAGLEEVTA